MKSMKPGAEVDAAMRAGKLWGVKLHLPLQAGKWEVVSVYKADNVKYTASHGSGGWLVERAPGYQYVIADDELGAFVEAREGRWV